MLLRDKWDVFLSDVSSNFVSELWETSSEMVRDLITEYAVYELVGDSYNYTLEARYILHAGFLLSHLGGGGRLSVA